MNIISYALIVVILAIGLLILSTIVPDFSPNILTLIFPGNITLK